MKRAYEVGDRVHCNYAGEFRVDGEIVKKSIGREGVEYELCLLHNLRRRGLKSGDVVTACEHELSLMEN